MTMDSKIAAAMELLNDAAKEKKEEVGKLISEKYSYLKNTLVESPKDFVKENPWWAVGGLAFSILTVGIIFFLYQNQKK
jgi:ElaB/YqjD/DUF883 family membrane-anchored ribosome-binding protein